MLTCLLSIFVLVAGGGDAGWLAWRLGCTRAHNPRTAPESVNNRNADGFTALHLAAASNHLEVAEYLTSHGAEVNAKNKRGWTPLDIAARQGYLSMAQHLSKNGAAVNSKDNGGWTALHGAATRGRVRNAIPPALNHSR